MSTRKKKTVLVGYSFREYREVEVTLPAGADHDDEDVIRDAIAAQHGHEYSADEEFQVDSSEVEEE